MTKYEDVESYTVNPKDYILLQNGSIYEIEEIQQHPYHLEQLVIDFTDGSCIVVPISNGIKNLKSN